MNKNARYSYYFICLIIAFFSCAVHTGLEPVGKNNLAAQVSLGGPVIKAFDLHFPMPMLACGGTYGLDNNLNLSGNFNVTSCLYSVIGLDPAVTWFPRLQEGLKPTVGLQAQALLLGSVKSKVTGNNRFRVYPVLSATAAWHLGPGLVYTGSNLTIPLTRPDFDENAPKVIWSPCTGYRWNLTSRARFIAELKYHAPHVRSNELAITYNNWEGTGITYGALSPLFGFEWSFK